ncbi:MAG: hypothetical protein ACREQF_09985 [Candidatus Binataceae bacterium]
MSPQAVSDPGSLRDPEGVVLVEPQRVLRAVKAPAAERLDSAALAKFLERLSSDRIAVATRKLPVSDWPDRASLPSETVAVYEHSPKVPFVSYPYEWPFTLLKRAALAQLDLQVRCLEAGFILKDASAYNTQFIAGRPLFVDVLSIETYKTGEPWIAYGQFCRHFLNPLLVQARAGVEFQPLLKWYVDGVEPRVAAQLLPLWRRFTPPALVHVTAQDYLGRGAESANGLGSAPPRTSAAFNVAALLRLANSLRRAIERLDWTPPSGVWTKYDLDDGYAPAAAAAKRSFVAEVAAQTNPTLVLDLGANVGAISKLAAGDGRTVVAMDRDHACVEQMARRSSDQLLPLVMDLLNPSTDQGFAGRERKGLAARGPADLLLALALIHHLALSAGLALDTIIRWMGSLTRFAVLEFVPAEDPRAAAFIARRGEPNGPYSRDAFEAVLSRRGRIHHSLTLPDSLRSLYFGESAEVADAASARV